MKQIAVDVTEVLDRAVEGLADLRRGIGARVVRQANVLALDIRELRLNEDGVGTLSDGSAGCGLVIVPALVRGVDSAETHRERQLHERLGALLFPGGSVEKRRTVGGGCPPR